MPTRQPGFIHPTAVISPEAEIAEDVQIGAYVVIEGPVHIGPGCVLRPGAHLVGPLTLGQNNQVFSYAVLGERPQHVNYQDEATTLEVGDNNVFREHVTVHRGTSHSWKTVIGSNNFLMAGCHVAHDCRIGNSCILANGALVAGHCVLEDNVFLSGNTAVHQFIRLGRLSLLSGVSATSKDVPPFIIQQGHNCVMGINAIGMRRAGVSTQNIDGVRRAFQLLYRENLMVSQALTCIDGELGHIPEVREMTTFIRASSRGINLCHLREAA